MSGTFSFKFYSFKTILPIKPHKQQKNYFHKLLAKIRKLTTPLRIGEQEIADGIITEDAGGNVALPNVDPDGTMQKKLPWNTRIYGCHSTLENLDDTNSRSS